MAIREKKRYYVYLTQEYYESVKSFVDTVPGAGGVSALLDNYLYNMAETLKAAGIKPGDKLTAAKIIRMAIKGGFRK